MNYKVKILIAAILIIFSTIMVTCKSTSHVSSEYDTVMPMDDFEIKIDSIHYAAEEDSIRYIHEEDVEREDVQPRTEDPHVKKSSNVSNVKVVEDTVEESQETPYIKSHFNVGMVSYTVPDTMYVNEISKVTLVIAYAKKIKEIIEAIPEFNDSNVTSEKIRVSKRMMVKLKDPSGGTNFKIIKILDSLQLVEKHDYTRWEWAITPLAKGSFPLVLTIYIVEGNASKNLKVLNTDIQIFSHETLWHKITSFFFIHWKWFISTLILPFMIFIWKKFKKKEEEE